VGAQPRPLIASGQGAIVAPRASQGSGGGNGCPAGSGGGSGRLSAGDYGAQLEKVAKESTTAQHAVEKGFHATTLTQLVTVLAAFGAAQTRIGDEVAALKPPTNAAAANTELVNGLHDTGSEVQALLPKVEKMPDANAAVAYLSKTPTTKSGNEIDQALAQLEKLGYIKSVS
jgi:hypothetical protein